MMDLLIALIAAYAGYFIGMFVTVAGGILLLTHCGAEIVFKGDKGNE